MTHAALRCAWLAAGLALAAATPAAQAQSLKIFGSGSTAYDVSANGTVTYTLGGSNYLWSLVTDSSTAIGGTAVGTAGVAGRLLISADGTRVAGSTLNTTTGKYVSSYYSTSTGTWTQLNGLGGSSGNNALTTWDMSSDGRYIVGNSYTAVGNYLHATISDAVTGATIDVGQPGNVQSRVNAISTNGQVAIGYSSSSRYGSIWRDPESDGSYAQTIVTHPVGGNSASEGRTVSGNGLWAAGASFNTALPYLVNVATGVVTTFPKLPFNDGSPSMKSTASPSAISEDGLTVIGTHSIGGTLDTNYGFIWTASGGVLDIDSHFALNGVDTANAYNFVSPIGMTVQADGSTAYVGIALQRATGAAVGFFVNIPSAVPEPASVALLLGGLGVVGFVTRRRRCRPLVPSPRQA